VLSQPDGSISEAHYKQDYHIESYRVAQLEGDPLVGPNCFSYTDDWGEPLYKLCHRSDAGAAAEGPPPTPSSRRSSYAAEEELVEGMDAEVAEALTVLEHAMARVMKLQQQSKVSVREELMCLCGCFFSEGGCQLYSFTHRLGSHLGLG